MSVEWNPWHGCTKYSEGCENCYVYRRDESIVKNAHDLYKTHDFDLPIRKNKDGSYKIPSGTNVYLCMTSDFFLDRADVWREDAWNMIRERHDLRFTVITKRIERFMNCIPADWGDGWRHVTVMCTVENQKQCDIRLPIYIKAPIRRKVVICEPLLGKIDMSSYLIGSDILKVCCGGESGPGARVCSFEWVLDLRDQCLKSGKKFYFKQTGARFEKDGIVYQIPRKLQAAQAKKANININ